MKLFNYELPTAIVGLLITPTFRIFAFPFPVSYDSLEPVVVLVQHLHSYSLVDDIFQRLERLYF